MKETKPLTLNRLERFILYAILCCFAILCTLYSVYVPIFEASDELWHYPMVEVIARTWTLPVQPLTPGESSGPWRQEGSQPPLYYATGALLTTWIDTSDMDIVRYLNPHVAAGEIRSDMNNVNLVVHNPKLECFPWQGTVLAVHIVRLFSVLLGTWAVYLTYALVIELFPQNKPLALLASAIHAFTPMYLFVSSSVNNDNLIIPLCSLSLLLMVRHIKYADPRDPGESRSGYVQIGCVLGLAMLTKASGLGLLPLAAATISWHVWQRIYQKHHTFSLVGLIQEIPFALTAIIYVVVPILALSGWWFLRNKRLYGEMLGLNAFYAVLGMRTVAADLSQLWSERFAFAAGYWGNFGGLNVPLPQWIYSVLNTIVILSIAGVIIAFVKWLVHSKKTDHRSTTALFTTIFFKVWPFKWTHLTAARALSWAWPAAVFTSWLRWASMTWSSQGRLIFSALPMWSLAIVIGIQALIPISVKSIIKKHISPKILLSSVFAVILCILCIITLPKIIVPSYTPPTYGGSEPTISYIRDFGDTLKLRGYTVHNDKIQPGGNIKITLYWQALNPTTQDHSIFIHVLGYGDRIIAQRDTFPGNGLVSTTWMQPGTRWAETHEIAVPELAYTPDTYTIGLGLYNTQSGQRAQVFDVQSQYQGEMALFGQGRLIRPDADIPNSINAIFGHGITLQGYAINDVIVERGQQFDITLYWSSLSAVNQDYTISVQLIDSQWNKAGQVDSWPMNGQAPTSSWIKGQEFIEERTLNVGPDSTPGLYDLRIAIYRINDVGEIEHLPVVWHDGQMPATSLTLTRINVQ